MSQVCRTQLLGLVFESDEVMLRPTNVNHNVVLGGNHTNT